jgi:hypothetical protein
MGLPEMDAYWRDLCACEAAESLDRGEQKTFRRLLKAFHLLAANPRHPGLSTHEIAPLSRMAGFKVWQSYIENHTPAAGRIFWAYGPAKGQITVLGFEPHPEDAKKAGYTKVRLSALPPLSS